jgi:hypothetical protein
MSADVEEVKAELYGKLESLYSAVNRLRFYRELAMLEEAESLEKTVKQLREELALNEEEVEKLADELDEYYITGRTEHGEEDPISRWADIVYKKLFKT